MDSKIAIRVSNLNFTYPDGTPALRGVFLTVRKGESLGIMGPNGAGKSTLALHLNGILQGEGEVEIMGLPINKKNLKEIRRKVGFVFQDPDDQLFCPTVREDVAFGPLNMGLAPDVVEWAVGRSLAWVGMEGSEDRSPHHMSFGEKKRVALATVLSMEPEILVLDEPVANLDPQGRREFINLVKSLDVTKVIVSHDISLNEEVCNRIAVMDKGKIVAEGPTSKILEEKAFLLEHGLA
ncbi:MAG: ABC transporter ATP-binding protein [Actinomycetota bacterium]|nr:ABC transporter ATP-binding protein [Actinomycetota bacterium]